MKSHIDIINGGKSLALKPDTSVTFNDSNPYFNDIETFSLPCEIPFRNNRHLLKNFDDINSDIRTMAFERKDVDVYINGLPVSRLYINVQEDSEVKDALSVNFDSKLGSLDSMIQDLDCQDIPVKDKIQIGEKIGNVEISGLVNVKAAAYTRLGETPAPDTRDYGFYGSFEPQALGFSYPGECYTEVDGYTAQPADGVSERVYADNHTVKVPKVKTSFINVSEPYGSTVNSPYKDKNGATIGWPFCNARVCYTHYNVKKNDDGTEETTDEVVQAKNGMYSCEDYGPYWVLGADRPQSGICFYVLYFLDCLFDYLGLEFDNTELTAIEDFKHLAFFTTKCCYDVEDDGGYAFDTRGMGGGSSPDAMFREVQKWLDSRGCGGKFDFGCDKEGELEKYENDRTSRHPIWEVGKLPIEYGHTVGDTPVNCITTQVYFNYYGSDHEAQWRVKAKVLKMYANSMNFPDASVKSVLDSLQNSFGIRFMYNEQKKTVKAVLYRNMFRSTKAPLHLMGKVLEMVPVTEKITGVRVCYSAEEDKKEQQDYVRKGVRDYDTDYNYNDYKPDMIVLDKRYQEFFKSLSLTDMHVYVDLVTGNAYRVKINSEATSIDTMAPVMFEVGQFKGIEEGDCSDENEDYVKKYVSDFTPVAFSDVNYFRETNNPESAQPVLAAFIDKDMEHEFVEQRIQSACSSTYSSVWMLEKLSLVESYDPTQTDDGNSPLQDIDWGMSIAMMRGGGTDMKIVDYDFDYDNMGNSRWKTVAGMYALSSDTMDHFGNEFDYNGEEPGDGGGERFSLKVRAYKPFRYYYDDEDVLHISTDPKEWDDPKWLMPCVDDEHNQQGQITRRIRSRGTADTFLLELIHFLLNRKPYKVRALVSIAQLIDIKNHWGDRYEINGKIGWINKLNYTVDVEKGLGTVEIEFFAL